MIVSDRNIIRQLPTIIALNGFKAFWLTSDRAVRIVTVLAECGHNDDLLMRRNFPGLAEAETGTESQAAASYIPLLLSNAALALFIAIFPKEVLYSFPHSQFRC